MDSKKMGLLSIKIYGVGVGVGGWKHFIVLMPRKKLNP